MLPIRIPSPDPAVAKYAGMIGFATTVEKKPGVWVEEVVERPYRGDVIKNVRNLESEAVINDDLNINNSFSIIADPYVNGNLFALRYLEWMGSRWKINTISVERPRLLLTVRGLYNGPLPAEG